MLATAGCASSGPTAATAPASAPTWQPIAEIPLDLRNPSDLRWLDDDAVAIIDGLDGLFRLSFGDDGALAAPLPLSAGRASETGPTVRLGLSDSHLAVGQSAFLVRWQARAEGASAHTISVEYVADLDLREDQILLIGVRREDRGALAPDAAIAWQGTLATEVELQPVQRSAAGRGAASMQDCALVDLSQVRFLSDGSFLIVPGVDPGIYLYDRNGALAEAWDTSRLGIDTGCPPHHEQRPSLAADPAARTRFLSSRRVVDDILPLTDGPALVVRSVTGEAVRWEVVRLTEASAPLQVVRLPFAGRAGDRLKADVRGDRVAMLIAGEIGGGSTNPRLIFMEVQP